MLRSTQAKDPFKDTKMKKNSLPPSRSSVSSMGNEYESTEYMSENYRENSINEHFFKDTNGKKQTSSSHQENMVDWKGSFELVPSHLCS